jgi:Porin subfamily
MCLAFPAYQKWMINMKLSTVLLSSAALLVAGAAYAADLPAKKAAPAAAPTGCAAFGAGYIAIPGGDTCLKVSGYVDANTSFSSPVTRPTGTTYSLGYDYGVEFDSAANSDMGAIKSQILFEDTTGGAPTPTFANVSIGGFTAGKADGLVDIGGSFNVAGDAYSGKVPQLQYALPLGAGSTLAVAAASAANNNNTAGTALASRPDLIAMLTTKMGAVTVNAGAASHEAAGSNSGTAQGYAVIGKVTFDAGVAKIMGYAAYANAAATYIGAGYSSTTLVGLIDIDANAANQSSGSMLQSQIDVPVSKADTLGLFAESINATSNAGSGSSKYNKQQYAIALKHTIAPGLWIRPELYQNTLDTGSGSAITSGAYIRIERDF